ncbi:dipeptide/oligopeptide/nickel ABC transporter permease/ATP-binding protein [Deinococcus roseus]|uniref:Peptide ABC transporter ATP-binding protein n=1 Tax=Deinococcus roseus TaxID=392414 RepID=A0ABQ2DG03_9DEIO|nr:dipeptide/oligopeptide/nickel ABC transporter permease/ATP-binding protein [Deinococcus roseus]GGJ54452.1 peptide ABC transporter ATP-binding protein [Deinococcus roseus]
MNQDLFRQPRAIAGMVLLGVLVLMGVFAPLLTEFNPNRGDLPFWLPPSKEHLLGTTALGQDIFSQMLYGSRLTLLVGFVAGITTTLIAVTLGLTAAYFGGWIDETINTLTNVFLVLPGLPLLIVASTFLQGGGLYSIILVISFTGWAFGARVIRSQALALRSRDFIHASSVIGESPWRIIFFEMMPNMTGLIAANFFGAALYAVLSEAALSFIGLGDVGLVTWGTMLFWAGAKGALLQGAWWWIAAPGLCISLVGTSFALLNFTIDQLQNPRLMVGPARRKKAVQRQTAAAPLPGVLLDIRDLNAGYRTSKGQVRAVREVSLTVKPGEFVGLAGESGCGKSTLAFAATRLLEAPGEVFSGQSLLNGQDLLSLPEAQLRQTRWRDYSVVFQASMNILNPIIKVREQVYDAMLFHGVTDRKRLDSRARELFRLVGIRPEFLDSFPHQLSGGMKQRVVIAIALALEPRLIVMDEPTTALDVVVQRSILQEIDQVRRKLGISIVFITHDLSLLVEMADRICIMYAGEIVEEAPAQKLYQHPQHPYTRKLMNAFPPLTGPKERRDGIPGRPPALSQELKGCPFFERCDLRMAGTCDTFKPQRSETETDHAVACFLHETSGKEPSRETFKRA